MTRIEKSIVVGLILLWALLYVPKLRTNPNWYGDEGEWMEESWTLIHGVPRVGPITNDFIFPYPYPPLYMLVNGVLLYAFGNDIVVGRSLGAAMALAAAAILFWIGTRVRDKHFGFLCAAAFLVYAEANINFRWVRSHPMAGTFALASIGFLVRYVQERRLADIVWAGTMCTLATATNYFTYPLVVAVVVTVALVNRRELSTGAGWYHIAIASATAGASGMLFVLWYVALHGVPQLQAHLALLNSVAINETRPTLAGELVRFVGNVWTLGFKTPTQGPPQPSPGHDWWLTLATIGFVFLPARDWRLRLWLPFWLLMLMYGVFKKLNNVPLFFYPATIFLPLMAIGFAGVLAWAGEAAARWKPDLRSAPAVVVLLLFALPSARGAWTHFDTKIDIWTQQSVGDAEAAMGFVNARVAKDDFVIVPKQIYWLAQCDRHSMLTFCARYEGVDNDMPVPVHIPRDLFWFDCRLREAKYLVLESGTKQQTLADGRRVQFPVGIDAVYTLPRLRGVRDVLEQTQRENWPVVFRQGAYIVLANPRFVN